MDALPEFQTTSHVGPNGRVVKEYYVKGLHMSLDDVKKKHRNQYTDKDVVQPGGEATNYSTQVPHYPRPVEFRVTTVAHVTVEKGLHGIMGNDGFQIGESGLLWWGLVIGEKEISAAEQRYVEKLFPDRNPEDQEPFLQKFATSPVFKDGSRYGNFKFTFSLADVLLKYSTQFCGGKDPVFRVYKTAVYSQEVMYTLLIHSPDVHDYDVYPELVNNDEAVCAYRDGEIIWRAQAISETHKFKLVENREEKLVRAEQSLNVFYVWDHVTLAFHIPKDETLSIPHEELVEALTSCDENYPPVNGPLMGKSDAEERVQKYKNLENRETSNMEF
ncbi:uncharacterized protein LOC134064062 [Sardina pilchardus]|uniref:uncharacterized protein LOC134064062 n=1 Tax=Sardina pilchardus TaxID=27697 RepID=UPI002E11C973